MNFDLNISSFIQAVGGVVVRVGTDELINQLFTDPTGVTHQAVVAFNPVTGAITLSFASDHKWMSAVEIVRKNCGGAQGDSISAISMSDRRMNLSEIHGVLWAISNARQQALSLPLQLQERGWKKFHLHSEYWGTKYVQDGDRNQTFLFRPEVDFERWVGVSFTHGSSSSSRSDELVEFDEWLDTLTEGEDYIEL